jgi:hypothetical protein
MYQDIIEYRDNFPIEMLLVSLGEETRIAGNLRKILHMIDINKNCTNYINKFNPHSSNSFLDMTTGIGCNEIKEIFNCFKKYVEPKLLNEKIKEYIENRLAKIRIFYYYNGYYRN